ncbi:aKG-HExxH-type peptide beta-hydroxylase [Nannocystis punicea]|uniref:HEXXH motif-containing putative peptide modification protein n=1 Tax=Nannocystis punicea TaxID=2995304 RepID=A0ABY7GU15_9BACT|nr:HEXXH motif-containing putative peptide modification protein [Nannocystis poenicansa]WAS90438.1 HEXXH motif-containing putative peptide modification protein [Nannocystis poenicansa]
MGIEVRPLGVRCNIGCQYCYQNPQRDAGNVARRYDVPAILRALEADPRPFSLFGGEALMVPLADLERLWAFGLGRHGGNTVQTNGTLIGEDHVAAFKRYKVRVGVSIDGPGELNDARWAGTPARTRELTQRTEAAIARLLAEGLPVSLIVTLHRGNATADKLPRMHAWLTDLAARGLRAARLHTLEVDDPAVGARYALDADENVAALRSFAALERQVPALKLDVFTDMRQMLRGRDARAGCVFRACDSYTTAAVTGIEGDGHSSNCGRTNKDGVDFTKADRAGYERYVALHRTPQRDGGCKDCRFFLMCKGHCPGTAIAGDWRNRSEHCDVHKRLFVDLEHELRAAGELPLSLHPLRPRVEAAMLAAWTRGDNPTVESALRAVMAEKTCSEEHVLKDMPRFVRVSWVSDAARRIWEPRLERVRRALQELGPVEAPQCCVEGGPLRDPVWRWRPPAGETVLTCAPLLSPLLARLGVRVLDHAVCSPTCAASLAAAEERVVALRLRDAEAAEWLLAMLSWPTRWSALHGIAEVKTPVFKLCHDSEDSPGCHAFVRAGDGWPEAGAQGTRPPFRAPARRLVSDAPRHLRGLAHAEGRARLPVLASAPAIAWDRLAAPQDDGHDAAVIVRLAAARFPQLDAARAEALAAAEVRVCDGRVAVRHVGERCPRAPDYEHGPLADPGLEQALRLLARWPAAARQLPQIVHTISPMRAAARPTARWPELRGSASTSQSSQFGVLWVTTHDPAATAQALVHEMAHNKLFALGLELESSARLIKNPLDRLYVSPIRTDRKRPMSAVFHAQYSFMHVTALDVAMLAGETDRDMRDYLAGLLRRNVERMEAGRREIAEHVETDADGAVFVAAFLDWTAQVLEAGHRALAEHGRGG